MKGKGIERRRERGDKRERESEKEKDRVDRERDKKIRDIGCLRGTNIDKTFPPRERREREKLYYYIIF